jgi:hypothetical protein
LAVFAPPLTFLLIKIEGDKVKAIEYIRAPNEVE